MRTRMVAQSTDQIVAGYVPAARAVLNRLS
jgi:hypothetical protein